MGEDKTNKDNDKIYRTLTFHQKIVNADGTVNEILIKKKYSRRRVINANSGRVRYTTWKLVE